MRNRTSFINAGLAMCGFLPLSLLAFWAYLPASAYDYATLTELLPENYVSLSQAGDERMMWLRGFGVVLAGAALTLPLTWLWRLQSFAAIVLAGAWGAFFLAQPALVPWVLQGDVGSALWVATGTLLLSAALAFFVLRLPACAAPLVLAVFLVGVATSVATAAQVVVRSEPPLFVLDRIAHEPDNPEAQLAMGVHLISIGGAQAALPYLRSAGEQLLETVDAKEQPELYASALGLAQLGSEALESSFEPATPDNVRK